MGPDYLADFSLKEEIHVHKVDHSLFGKLVISLNPRPGPPGSSVTADGPNSAEVHITFDPQSMPDGDGVSHEGLCFRITDLMGTGPTSPLHKRGISQMLFNAAIVAMRQVVKTHLESPLPDDLIVVQGEISNVDDRHCDRGPERQAFWRGFGLTVLDDHQKKGMGPLLWGRLADLNPVHTGPGAVGGDIDRANPLGDTGVIEATTRRGESGFYQSRTRLKDIVVTVGLRPTGLHP